MFKFLDAVSGHLKASLMQNFLFAGQPWWPGKKCSFKTHWMLPIISRIEPAIDSILLNTIILAHTITSVNVYQ